MEIVLQQTLVLFPFEVGLHFPNQPHEIIHRHG